ncbi:hypothetical protein [Variovorax sp. W2I14]|uniref:hypothetical protein n=1 Tax=Variovorax sp. W2I14 TaxID=3042290 RepID=UPI003D2321D6
MKQITINANEYRTTKTYSKNKTASLIRQSLNSASAFVKRTADKKGELDTAKVYEELRANPLMAVHWEPLFDEEVVDPGALVSYAAGCFQDKYEASVEMTIRFILAHQEAYNLFNSAGFNQNFAGAHIGTFLFWIFQGNKMPFNPVVQHLEELAEEQYRQLRITREQIKLNGILPMKQAQQQLSIQKI